MGLGVIDKSCEMLYRIYHNREVGPLIQLNSISHSIYSFGISNRVWTSQPQIMELWCSSNGKTLHINYTQWNLRCFQMIRKGNMISKKRALGYQKQIKLGSCNIALCPNLQVGLGWAIALTDLSKVPFLPQLLPSQSSLIFSFDSKFHLMKEWIIFQEF